MAATGAETAETSSSGKLQKAGSGVSGSGAQVAGGHAREAPAVGVASAEQEPPISGLPQLPAGAVAEREPKGVGGAGRGPAPPPGRLSPVEQPRTPDDRAPPAGGAASRGVVPRRGARSPSRSHGVGVSPCASPWSRSLGIVSVGTVAGWTAHAGYYVLAFLAYWFGAARFDKSGAGEFDPTDVQRMINNLSRHMRFSFSRPRPRGRRLRERLRERRRKQQQDAAEARKRELAHEENLRQIRDAMEQEQGDAPARRPSVTSNLSAHAERAIYGMERAGDAIQAAIQAPVVSPECVEETVGDNLRQFWPWFSVSQILICFGLWLGYALQMHVYTVRTPHALFDQAAVMETFTDDFGSYYGCQVKCSTRGDACAGVAYREGLKPECRLLSELPQDLQSIQQCSEQRSWNWVVYEKLPRTIGTLLATMGGLETAFPGGTSLQSFKYCEEGFRAGIFWRLLEYQFTHGGLAHVGGNCLVIFFVGVPLEGFHGTGLTALMHTVGVVGGGMAWMLLNPHRRVFGASGGAYALLGMQLADLVLNWRQKKFRFPIFITLMVLVAIETAGYASATQGTMTTTAHSVHLGGLASGFIIGMLLTYNIEKTRSEMSLQVAALVTGLGLVCFAMAYWFDNPFPAIRSLMDAEHPFCWIGQVCMNEDGTDCDYSRGWQCVACDTRECVENWYKDEYVFCVTFGKREDCGDRLEDVDHKCVNC